MVRLEGGTHFLVVRRTADKHQVRSYAKFNNALKQVNSGQRISPIFALNGSPSPALSRGGPNYLYFIGPIEPGLLDFAKISNLYLSLGTFNVVVWCRDEEEREEITEFVQQADVPYESWVVNNGYLEDVAFHPEIAKSTPDGLKEPIHVKRELATTAREYSLLVANAVGLAGRYWPNHQDNFLQFDRVFRAILAEEADDLGRLTDLVVTNAALSRFVSQAYTGTSPLLETASGYTNHSLLGIGLASQALISLRDFASRVFTESRYLQRIRLLTELPAVEKPIFELPASDGFFDEDHLEHADLKLALGKQVTEPTQPILTCFSGRDGFRSTRFSLSAPLETISGANTCQWTLQTITHELSHVVIGGVLGVFFPKPGDPDSLRRASALLSKTFVAKSLFDRAEELLAYAFVLLELDHRNQRDRSKSFDIDPSPEALSECIIEGSAEANEILTHVFDFRYFYEGNAEHYIRSVWSSWAVVPNIELRIPDYISRTLCALFSTLMDWPIKETLDTFRRILEQVIQADKSPTTILKDTLDTFDSGRDRFEEALNARIPFVKFASAILYSNELDRTLNFEKSGLSGQGGDEGSFSGLEFRPEQIENPLRFLEGHAVESRPKMARSVWILQHLAFCKNQS